jgi:hypothetical protein
MATSLSGSDNSRNGRIQIDSLTHGPVCFRTRLASRACSVLAHAKSSGWAIPPELSQASAVLLLNYSRECSASPLVAVPRDSFLCTSIHTQPFLSIPSHLQLKDSSWDPLLSTRVLSLLNLLNLLGDPNGRAVSCVTHKGSYDRISG